jgi:hypothetical protein
MVNVSFALVLNVHQPCAGYSTWSSCSSMMSEKDELKASEY